MFIIIIAMYMYLQHNYYWLRLEILCNAQKMFVAFYVITIVYNYTVYNIDTNMIYLQHLIVKTELLSSKK